MHEYARLEFGSISVVALSRHGGTSLAPFDSLNLGSHVGDDPNAVVANWRIVQDFTSAQGITFLHAEHGVQVHEVSKSNPPIGPQEAPVGDGLVCTDPGQAIVALSADCVPFALVDPVNLVIAVGHAGWKGVLANLMSELSNQFTKNGGLISHSVAVIGPSICGQCYEVPADRVSMFKSKMPAAISDETHLDLAGGVSAELNQLGYEVIEIDGCNFEDENLFSYRRANGKPTGRGGLVALINSKFATKVI